jgi:hypothetical protein
MFFFEKKNQKNSYLIGAAQAKQNTHGDHRAGAKVFCFYFLKNKSCLPCFATPLATEHKPPTLEEPSGGRHV